MFIVKSLLLGIGLAMDAVAVSMANGLQNPKMKEGEEASGNLLFQAVGTSVDALSLGFTFSLYSIPKVFISSIIIGIVTFILSYAAILVGRKFGTIYAGKADILGGIVLIIVAILL